MNIVGKQPVHDEIIFALWEGFFTSAPNPRQAIRVKRDQAGNASGAFIAMGIVDWPATVYPDFLPFFDSKRAMICDQVCCHEGHME